MFQEWLPVYRATAYHVKMVVILVFVSLTTIAYSERFISNALDGPFHMDETKLAAIGNPDTTERYFITVDGSKLTPTSINWQRDGSAQPESVLALLSVGNHLLPVKMSKYYDQTSFTGELGVIPEEIKPKLDRMVESNNPQLKSAILPMMLTENFSFRVIFYGLSIVCGGMLLAAIWHLVKVILYAIQMRPQ